MLEYENQRNFILLEVEVSSYKKKFQRTFKVYDQSDSSTDDETLGVHKTTEVCFDLSDDGTSLLAPPSQFEDTTPIASLTIPPPVY